MRVLCVPRRNHRLWLKRLAIVNGILTGILFYMATLDRAVTPGRRSRSTVKVFPEIHRRNSSRKLILLWTKFWTIDHWSEYDTFGIPACARHCDVTIDKGRLRESDAVLFHWGNMEWGMQLPDYRRPDQVWVVYNGEPPHKQSNMAPWPNIFNWTMSYRTDSTVYTPFGRYRERNSTEKAEAQSRYSGRNFAKERNLNISLTISNCNDQAGRYRLAQKVNKLLKVDMFGNCGGESCPYNTPDCNTRLGQYKFHMALENSYCRDYFSEKVWLAYGRDVVPIVAWQQHPGHSVPPHSYINIFDFPDLESFVAYLELVIRNDTLYNSYFDWKLKYFAHETYNQQWCPLCDELLNASRHAQVIKDPYVWFSDDYCYEPLVYTWLKILLDRVWFAIGL